MHRFLVVYHTQNTHDTVSVIPHDSAQVDLSILPPNVKLYRLVEALSPLDAIQKSIKIWQN